MYKSENLFDDWILWLNEMDKLIEEEGRTKWICIRLTYANGVAQRATNEAKQEQKTKMVRAPGIIDLTKFLTITFTLPLRPTA